MTRLYREYADLYDIAFGWDLDEEAAWLVERPAQTVAASSSRAAGADACSKPINTLAHLRPAELVRHLECMGRHLRPGGRYLVQLALRSESTRSPERPSRWETERGGTRLRVTWQTVEIDLEEAVERQLSRIEVLDGRAGEVVEEEHRVTAWSPHSWTAAVAASPFRYSAAYDGDAEGRPGVEPGTAGRLIWHELTRR